MSLPGKMYETNLSVIEEMNRLTNPYDIQFWLRTSTFGKGKIKTVSIVVGNTYIFRPNKELSTLLGIQERDYIEGEYMTNRAMKLLPHCNILEHVIVGDITAPLLRIVDVETDSNNSNRMHKNMHTQLFVPIEKKSSDTIEISIMTDEGKPVPFSTGKRHVVLEFKKSGLLDNLI